METVVTYTCETMFVSSDQRRIINKVLKLKEKRPQEVELLELPETNDGCIYAKMPAAWFQIAPPRKVELTEEQRQERAERLARMRQNRAPL